MPAFKLTMVFNYLSGQTGGGDLNLKGGWTESIYWNQFVDATLRSFKTLCQFRANMLPVNSYISGIRVQQVDPTGSSQTFAVNYPGGGGALVSTADIPQMALLVRARGQGVPNVRSMRLSAIPDTNVQRGEYKPAFAYDAIVQAFLSNLAGWRFRATDITQPQILLLSVAADGTYTSAADIVAPVGSWITIRDSLDSQQQRWGGRFRVKVATSLRAGILDRWPGATTLGGTIRLSPYIYPVIVVTPDDISRIVVRKVGRPSLGYRGRRSRRRKSRPLV